MKIRYVLDTHALVWSVLSRVDRAARRVAGFLDTHALVWSVLSPERLGANALRIMESAGPGELAITSASIMELGRLIDADKIDLNSRRPSDVFEDALAYNTVIPVGLEAAIKAPVLAGCRT